MPHESIHQKSRVARIDRIIKNARLRQSEIARLDTRVVFDQIERFVADGGKVYFQRPRWTDEIEERK